MRQIFFILLAVLMSVSASAQVGINTETPAESAALDVTSTDKGFLPPRMTTAQRDAISNAVEGLVIYNSDKDCIELFVGYWRNMCAFAGSNDVMNPATGLVWMDRNLGATQVATSSTDANSYGNLYQWGRGTEGHEIRISETTSTNATTHVPNAGNPWDALFITEGSPPFDWLTPQDTTLWHGANGTNNPCPSGYRLPTDAEWNAELLSWKNDNSAGAFDSPLKLPMAGYRFYSDGSLINVGDYGFYWSSTVSSTVSLGLGFNGTSAGMEIVERAYGGSVRCLKD